MDLFIITGAVARRRAAFGQGTGAIFIDNVVCSGQELRLTDCASNALAAHDCTHAEDAGVVCQPATSRKYVNRVMSQHDSRVAYTSTWK